MAELQDGGGDAVVPAEPLLRRQRGERLEERRVGDAGGLG
jgi:hypothetical protein